MAKKPTKDYEYVPERGTSTALAKAAPVMPIVVGRTEDDSIRVGSSTMESLVKSVRTAGSKALPKPVDRKLRGAVDVSEVDILSSGELYVSHVFVRRRLNDALGPMAWALIQLTEPDTKSANDQMFIKFALIVLGRLVSIVYGSAKYFPTSKRMDFADTAEAVKSNALTRACKDLGIASECWDRRWCDAWRDKHAVHVFVLEKQRDGTKEQKAMWRRVDARPFRGELKPVPDSPNQDRWRKQWEGWNQMLEKELKASEAVYAHRQELLRKAKAQGVKPAGGEIETPAPVTDSNKSEPRTSEPKPSPTSHGRPLSGDERPHKIRECKIIERAATYVLHKVTMMDGSEYTTFSSTVYAELQKAWAEGRLIEITSEEHKAKGRTYRNIVEFSTWKGGNK